jgi:lambda family phage minor tail protein L
MTAPNSELLTLTPDAIVSLYILDLTPLGTNQLYKFCNWKQSDGADIIFQGQTYISLPFEASGFELSTRGQPAQPSITLSNIFGVFTAFSLQFNDLVGATLIRKRTLAKYLDNSPTADPNMEFSDDRYRVWRKSQESELRISYELRRFSDLGFRSKIPARIIIKNSCFWQYRSSECGYAGGVIADENDNLTNDLSKDACGKRLSSCKLRFGQYGELPFGGYPGVDS